MSGAGIRYDLEFGSIPNMVRTNARRFAGREAVVDGSLRWTFDQLDAEMVRAVRAMIAAGVRPGDRIGLWAPNSALWIVAALAVQGAGGVLVPVNTRFKGAEAAHVLVRSGASMLLTVTDFLGLDLIGMLRAAAPATPALARIVVLSGDVPSGAVGWAGFLAGAEQVDESDAVARIAAVRSEDLSDVMFTSGTTGSPKGVMLTHGQSLRAHGWYTKVLTFGPGDRYLIVPPFFHTFGYKAGWMGCLVHGVTALPVATFSAGEILRRVVEDRITILLGPPAMFTDLLALRARTGQEVGSIRVVMMSAAKVAPSLVRRVRAELAVEVMASSYGQTEGTSLATTTYPGIDLDSDVVETVGRAALDVELRVVDDAGRPCPPGTPGELLVRGYNVMQGYWDDPEATAEVVDADGWLHSGDVVVMDERGFVTVTDRRKDMYITGGFNVYPAEVELSLGRHPDVADIAVVGVPDARMGEVGAAFVVPRAGATLSPGSLRTWANEQIAGFKVPAHVELVDELPRNASMKVTKHVLRERARRIAGAAE